MDLSLLRITKEIDSLIEKHHFETLGAYWDEERRYVDDEYRNIPFPFSKIETPSLYMEFKWKIEELEGFLNTWSALQKFIAANDTNPVPQLIKRIRPYWKEDAMTVRFPIHLLLARIGK